LKLIRNPPVRDHHPFESKVSRHKYGMPHYKIIATSSWEFEAIGSLESITEQARKLVNNVIAPSPQGEDYRNFGIQMELVPLKDKSSSVNQLKTFTPEQVFSWITDSQEKTLIRIAENVYEVKMNSDRYRLFQQNPTCVSCGLTGNKFILENPPGEFTAHFNFYAEEDGRNVLMTKDHIKAKSYGGADSLDNYQTMCQHCNAIKASFPLSNDSVRKLREILKNKECLGTKELRKKINQTRLLLLDSLTGQ
jgi:hypothetical protein